MQLIRMINLSDSCFSSIPDVVDVSDKAAVLPQRFSLLYMLKIAGSWGLLK